MNKRLIYIIIRIVVVLALGVGGYLGFLTLFSFAFTAYIGFTNYKNTKNHLPFKFHPAMVIVSFSIAVIHMFFAGSIFLGY